MTIDRNQRNISHRIETHYNLNRFTAMKNIYFFLAGLISVTLGYAAPVRAKEFGIEFDLSSNQPLDKVVHDDALAESKRDVLDEAREQPLHIPAEAVDIPSRSPSASPVKLPPPPPQPAAESPITPSPDPESRPQPVAESVALTFDLPPTGVGNTPSQSEVAVTPSSNSAMELLFKGGADSLVAKAVGSAEGTRTPVGDRTLAYYGHVDPGNQALNLGTFSYQHGAKSPEEADEKQLKRLQRQAKVLQRKAETKGMQLTLAEKLNAIDLANQAPRAALEHGGYLDWLYQAHEMGLQGSEAIRWARVRSFLDPDTRRWNAPGLGNNINRISRDQERRMQQIERVIEIHQEQQQGGSLPQFQAEQVDQSTPSSGGSRPPL
jgi:hypothetical protein